MLVKRILSREVPGHVLFNEQLHVIRSLNLETFFPVVYQYKSYING